MAGKEADHRLVHVLDKAFLNRNPYQGTDHRFGHRGNLLGLVLGVGLEVGFGHQGAAADDQQAVQVDMLVFDLLEHLHQQIGIHTLCFGRR